jgi:multicomponent Na+:H+ antiporter subunit G
LTGLLIQELVAIFFFVFGLFFSFVGVLGVIRLPDAYSRLHASGKVATLGLLGIIVGVGILIPGSILKLLALMLFVAIVAPVNSHVIAKADKEYSIRQNVHVRDSSISAEGDQPEITQEFPQVAANDQAS